MVDSLIALDAPGHRLMTTFPRLPPISTLKVQADGTTGDWSAQERLPWNEHNHGKVARGWLQLYNRKDGSHGHRLLISGQDHSLRLVQAGMEGWVREEALGTVEQAEFIPLPSRVVAGVRCEQ